MKTNNKRKSNIIVKLLMTAALLVSCLMATVISAGAANEPFLAADEIHLYANVGDVVELKYTYFPKFQNEKVYVNIYDSDENCVASSEKSFSHYDSRFINYTLSWDTDGYPAGEYTVVATVDFYSYYDWHESPNVTTSYVTLKEVHKHSYTSKVTKQATCATAGVMTYTCSCGDSYTKAIPATGKHTYQTKTIKAATTSKDGKAVKVCTVCGKQSKTQTAIPKISSVKLSATKYTYSGKAKTPTVTVKDSKGKTLKKNTDYTVKYASGRKTPGKYAVKVTFKGKYSGTKTLYFTITPGTPTLKVTAGSKKASLSWNKQTGASGYVVYMATSKKGTYKKVGTVKSGSTVKYTKTGLTKGKTYYFKVVAYTKADSGNIYGSYSSAKSVKVK